MHHWVILNTKSSSEALATKNKNKIIGAKNSSKALVKKEEKKTKDRKLNYYQHQEYLKGICRKEKPKKTLWAWVHQVPPN